MPATMRTWGWRALETARHELRLAMDSVLEDLEDLGARAKSATPSAANSAASSAAPPPSDAATESTDVLDTESTRIDDLVGPSVVRLEYEQEVAPEFSLCPAERCQRSDFGCAPVRPAAPPRLALSRAAPSHRGPAPPCLRALLPGHRCEGFELIDFEAEAEIISFSG